MEDNNNKVGNNRSSNSPYKITCKKNTLTIFYTSDYINASPLSKPSLNKHKKNNTHGLPCTAPFFTKVLHHWSGLNASYMLHIYCDFGIALYLLFTSSGPPTSNASRAMPKPYTLTGHFIRNTFDLNIRPQRGLLLPGAICFKVHKKGGLVHLGCNNCCVSNISKQSDLWKNLLFTRYTAHWICFLLCKP